MEPTQLSVALDVSSEADADRMIGSLEGLPVIWKVGLELFILAGPAWVRDQVSKGHKIFLDLKMYDIPNTVSRAAQRIGGLGVHYFTVHLSGGPRMIQPLGEELERLYGEKRPKILGVSVLTSFDQTAWDETTFAISGSKSKISESAKRFLAQAKFWGVDGVVCSAHELKIIRKMDLKILSVVPGIRPRGSARMDQARVTTPSEAAKQGANIIVVGRPIIESKQPREVAEKILKDLNKRSGA